MKTTLMTLLMACLGLFFYNAQQSNTFEDERDMPIVFDTTNTANVWQIGEPAKDLFSSALSEPNALITDTLNDYPPGSQSSFYFKINMSTLWTGYPYFVLLWDQKMDCEVGTDGGVIEVSYDSMQSWVNVFEDMVYEPMAIGDFNMDVLFNGEPGITEIDTSWKQIGFCWSSSEGDPIDEAFIRFTFYSDSTETNQEGWMIDNFEAFPSIVDNVEELSRQDNRISSLKVYPNPASGEINIKREGGIFANSVIQIYNLSGDVVFQKTSSNLEESGLDVSHLKPGTYVIVLKNSAGRIYGMKKLIIVGRP